MGATDLRMLIGRAVEIGAKLKSDHPLDDFPRHVIGEYLTGSGEPARVIIIEDHGFPLTEFLMIATLSLIAEWCFAYSVVAEASGVTVAEGMAAPDDLSQEPDREELANRLGVRRYHCSR